MFGNCAVGSASMATIPTSTIRIEMTIATMGRRMKKFDIILLPLCRFCRSQFRVYHCTLFRFLNALDNHALTRLKTLVDDPHFADSLSNLHRSNAGFVVTANRDYLICPLRLSNSALRDHQSVFRDTHLYSYPRELAGTENVPW